LEFNDVGDMGAFLLLHFGPSSTASPKKIEECGFESAQIKTIYRTRISLWIIIAQKTQMFDLDAYFLTAVGIRF